MGKLTVIILVLYVLYYAANICYDLFIKKDTLPQTADENEVVMEGLVDEPININIDDVEDLRTPSSFTNENLVPIQDENTFDAESDFETMRKAFESEEDFEEPVATSTPNSSGISIKWEEMLNQASTNVKVVDDKDGWPVYSIIQ